MTKTKALIILVIALLLLNLFLIFFGMKPKFDREHPHNRKMPKEIVIEILDFNESQVSDYIVLITEHREKISENDRKIREFKSELYTLLVDQNKTLQDSLIKEISLVQTDVEEIHFKHFEDIKELCTGSQLEKFTNFSEKLTRIFSHSKPMHHRKR